MDLDPIPLPLPVETNSSSNSSSPTKRAQKQKETENDLDPIPLPMEANSSSSSSSPSKQAQKRKEAENDAEAGEKTEKRVKKESETGIIPPPASGLEADIEQAILSLAKKRGLTKTFCPRYAVRFIPILLFPALTSDWTCFRSVKLFG